MVHLADPAAASQRLCAAQKEDSHALLKPSPIPVDPQEVLETTP